MSFGDCLKILNLVDTIYGERQFTLTKTSSTLASLHNFRETQGQLQQLQMHNFTDWDNLSDITQCYITLTQWQAFAKSCCKST